MTQLQWFQTYAKVAMYRFQAALLMATCFFGIGCSKSKPVQSPTTQNPSNVSSMVGTVASPTSVSTAVPPASQVQPPKKSPRKRPSTVTYKDEAYGVSFLYPRKYMLKTGDEAHRDLAGMGPVPSNFVQAGGVTVATVEMPRNSYPDTDFTSAFFNVSVNRSLTSSECEQFALPVHLGTSDKQEEPVPPAKVKVGSSEFAEVEDLDASKQADAKYYHLFENGACYEFTLGLGTSGNGPEGGTTPVDREQVFRKLEKILATVKIQSPAVPEVAASGPSHAADSSNQ
jgi:hypothetical protein